MVTLTGIYGNVLSSSRHHLWHDLSQISSMNLSNWFVLGDFNACFGAHEKTGRPPPRRSCSEFLSAMSDCGLTYLDTRGPLFTWKNNRTCAQRVDIRLDRAFCNAASLENWRFMECHALAHHQSDHNPIILCCKQQATFHHLPF